MEMEKSERKSCTFEGEEYSHGSEVCKDGKCMICNDGQWEPSVHVFPVEESEMPDEQNETD